MGRTKAVTAIAAIGALVAGCGGTSLLRNTGSSSASRPAAGRAYVLKLGAAQQRLLQAERTIPSRPRTPAAFSRSIGLLAIAISRLATDLSHIHPPATVASLHAHLVAVVRTYSQRLSAAARRARDPAGIIAAANSLISATADTTRSFSATADRISATVAR